ncbi:toll/interleukin-1 receptor domain-containing adapter protein [Chanos chanos]|uniref:Toll/interleukin-1 receptor domain-containing adapter protein n=1 Tax=Chanos chanos TaxID=29144 RepID=A0A6J2UM11_CHACN|nr:toll/interleukin-1 receptor domain-containing adapter protein [Chanos chanos]
MTFSSPIMSHVMTAMPGYLLNGQSLNSCESTDSSKAPIGHSSHTSSSTCCSSQTSLNSTSQFTSSSTAFLAKPLPSALSSAFRHSLSYDVCICHNSEDYKVAESLAFYLEAPNQGLRCYLPARDCPVGGARCTELCNAVRNSHCWVLLVSSHFLQDDWCLYQMQQALSQGPMSQRIIPTTLKVSYRDLPYELRFLYAIDLSRNPDGGYSKVYTTVLTCE